MFSLFQNKKKRPYQQLSAWLMPTASYGKPNASYAPRSMSQQQYASQPQQPVQASMKTQLPASGLGGQYANNEMTQRVNPQSPQPPVEPTQPQPQPQLQPQPQQQFTNPYLQRLEELMQNQSQAERSRAAFEANRQRQLQAIQEQTLRQSQNRLREQFSEYEQALRAAIVGQEQQTQDDIRSIEDYTGQQLRQAAEARRQGQQQVQNVFANLGTLDSSAFQNALINSENAAARQRERLLAEQGRDVRAMQRKLLDFRQQVQSQINQARYDLEDELATIDANIAQGTLAYEQAVQQAYQNAEDRIRGLEQAYYETAARLVPQFEPDETDALSEQFLTTGVPQNRADYLYRLKNRSKFEDPKTTAEKEAAQETANEVLTVIEQLKQSGGIPGITGLIRTGFIPNTKAAQAKSLYNRLKSLLSLENRQKLKGSGAISDFEAKMLARAATNLNQNMSVEQFFKTLGDIEAVYRRKIQQASSTITPEEYQRMLEIAGAR